MSKRLFDLSIVIPLCIVLLPIFSLLALWVRIDSEGPIIFKQRRVGRYGHPFSILKFRTMVQNAESLGPKVTVGGDPRVTKCGKFLRKSKLDELPQLLNVLKGEMSLVGPRPEVAEYVEHYPADLKDKILSVQPGITDMASIKYRDEEGILAKAADPKRAYIEEVMPVKLRYYSEYVDNRSLMLDMKILANTVLAILR